MHTPVNIISQSSYQSAAGSLAGSNMGTRGAYMQDNRASSVVQRKLVENMENRKSVWARINNLDLPLQLKTETKYDGQQYTYNGKSITVGKKMESWSDPNDLVQGQAAGINKSQDEMMAAIREKYAIDGGDVVKGHLLNDNLGGKAIGENLYPITRAANKDHLTHVENYVKKYVWEDKKPIYYSVEVLGNPDINTSTASFRTLVYKWDGKSEGTKDGVGEGLERVLVESDFGKPRQYGQAFDLDDPGVEAERESNPKKPKGFQKPYNRVGDLPDDQLKERNEDK
jgi:hypothetical protein